MALSRVVTLVASVVTSLGVVAGVLAYRARSAAPCDDGADHAACALPDRKPAPVAVAGAERLPEGQILVEFVSAGCSACRRMAPVLADVGRQCLKAGAKVVQLDVESTEGGALAARWGVTATPTLVFLDVRHEMVDRLVGAQPAPTLRRAVETSFGLECASLPSGARSG